LLNIGEKAPEFCLKNSYGEKVCLKQFAGKWVILFIYVRDNTKGCTVEAIEFSNRIKEAEELNTVIIGISSDSVDSHLKFKKKHNLRVILLSDPDKEMLKAYGVWGKKKMYGREYFGVIRSTFIINPKGNIAAIWPKVRVKEHTTDVIKKLRELRIAQ